MTIRNVHLVTAVVIALGLLLTVRQVLTAEGASVPTATPDKPSTLQVPFGLEDLASYIPTDNPLTVEKIELGKLHFFDPRLSADNKVACGGRCFRRVACRWKTISPVLRHGHHQPESLRGGAKVLHRLRGGSSPVLAQVVAGSREGLK
jgi:hypothetical protein